MKIQLLETSYKKYGGNIYERIVGEILEKYYDASVENIGVTSKKKWRYFQAFEYFYNMYKKSCDNSINVAIKPYQASIFFNNNKFVKNVVLIHHIDSSYCSLLTKLYQEFLEYNLKKNKKNIDSIIVVSKYWKKYVESMGFKKVFVLYNAFDIKEFDIAEEELEIFRTKHNFKNDKPIIYLGNPQPKKGVDRAFDELKDLDVQFVVSGTGSLNLENVKKLDLDYKEYLKLLKISDVVLTMSQFKEGWCRVAHEAMLLKTPVIGSGMGGMKELLLGGNQVIVEDFKELEDKVFYAINNKTELGMSGFKFARKFTMEKFEFDFKSIINEIAGA
jgi:glycosyltransferase involved in cell wall biosynthesis